MSRIGAVITAAGVSSRMGDFKPLMPYEDSTIIQVIIRKLKSCGAKDIVVVGGYRFDELSAVVEKEGAQAVLNEDYKNNHMFDSICIGLQCICRNTDKLFFWPTDVPGVRAETLHKILTISENNDVSAIIPYYKNEPGHPMLIMQNAYDTILSHDGTKGLRGAVGKLELAVHAKTEDPFVVMDTDTQEQYRALLSLEKSWNREKDEYRDDMDFNIHASIKRGGISVNETLFHLLEQIRKTGSIRQACEEIGISYTKAWTILKDAQKVFGRSLMETQTGGTGGGGASLTEAGQKFIRSYDAFCGEVDKYAAGIFGKHFGWNK